MSSFMKSSTTVWAATSKVDPVSLSFRNQIQVPPSSFLLLLPPSSSSFLLQAMISLNSNPNVAVALALFDFESGGPNQIRLVVPVLFSPNFFQFSNISRTSLPMNHDLAASRQETSW